MDDDDDIFANINNFCMNNILEKKLEEVNVKNDLSNDIVELDDNYFDKKVPTNKVSNNCTEPIPSSSTTSTSSGTRTTNKKSAKTTKNKAVANVSRRTRSKNGNNNSSTLNNDLGVVSSSSSTNSTNNSSSNTSNNSDPVPNLLLGEVLNLIRSSRRSQKKSSRRSSRRSNGSNSNTSVERNQNSFMAPQALPARANRCSRRLLLAETAARAPVVDCIDLVSSPLILPKTTINVDSDEENQNSTSKPVLNDVNDDLQSTPLRIKVKWGKEVKVFPYRKYQKFSDIIEHFAKLENVNKNTICLNLNDRVILEDDTPDSINYELHMFIYGRMVKDCIANTYNISKKDPNVIEIKIQCEGKKRPIVMSLKKSNTFAVLYEKCAEEFKLPISKISLRFDGDILQMNDKPEDFDFEGGEIIDCKIKS